MARERGITADMIQESRAEFEAGPAHGRKASKTLLGFAYASAFLGGLFGLAFGYSLAYTIERTPEGDFYRYDEDTRRIGRRILVIGIVMLAVTRFLWEVYGVSR